MSLINEALKKAQRQRTEEAADPAAAAAGVRIPKRSKATSANTMVLIGSGALVLVVLSVVLTVYFVNQPTTPPPHAATPATAPAAATPVATVQESAAPASVTPSVITPAATPPVAAASTAPASDPAPVTVATVPPVDTAAGASATSAAAEAARAAIAAPAAVTAVPAAPPAPAGPDERIASFVEAIRVTGIRSSGSESRVLMNERVYRVNDIVERTLNLRLIKVEADTLTFSDANGITYQKHF